MDSSTDSLTTSGADASPETHRGLHTLPSPNAEELPDFIIRCGDDDHHVHGEILSSSSGYLKAAINGEFKEIDIGFLELNDHHPTVVTGMLHFLYNGSYDTLSDDPGASTFFHVKTYVIADVLNIIDLKNIAIKQFDTLRNSIRSVHELFVCEDGSGMTDLFDMIDLVFTPIPLIDTGIRESMVRFCARHREELLEDPNFTEALSQHGDLGAGTYGSVFVLA